MFSLSIVTHPWPNTLFVRYAEQTVHNIILSIFDFQAYKRGYTYPRYAWIMHAWYDVNWWTLPSDVPLNCTYSQLAGFLEQALATQISAVTSNASAMTDTGLVSFNEILTIF